MESLAPLKHNDCVCVRCARSCILCAYAHVVGAMIAWHRLQGACVRTDVSFVGHITAINRKENIVIMSPTFAMGVCSPYCWRTHIAHNAIPTNFRLSNSSCILYSVFLFLLFHWKSLHRMHRWCVRIAGRKKPKSSTYMPYAYERNG